jgi:hypothetical protein
MAPAPSSPPRSDEFAYSTSLRKGLPHAAADLSHSAQAAIDRAEEGLVELAVRLGVKEDGHSSASNGVVKEEKEDLEETPSEAFSKLTVKVSSLLPVVASQRQD